MLTRRSTAHKRNLFRAMTRARRLLKRDAGGGAFPAGPAFAESCGRERQSPHVFRRGGFLDRWLRGQDLNL